MKKLVAIFLLLAMIVPAAFADPAEIGDKYSTYGRVKDTDHLFDADYFSIDFYMTTGDLNAYIVITLWKYHDIMTIVKPAKIKSKVGENNKLYFVFADESYYTGYYDGDYREYFWLDMENASVRLNSTQWFNPYSDLR